MAQAKKQQAKKDTPEKPAASKNKQSYATLDDLKKINKQWWKLSGLHTRAEWSAAVVRAATAAELAATYAIRQEFNNQSELQPDFVDGLLIWANGISGKFERLLKNLVAHQPPKRTVVKTLEKKTASLNKKRNAIAHSGEFCTKKDAIELIGICREIVLGLVQMYDPSFVLKERASDNQ